MVEASGSALFEIDELATDKESFQQEADAALRSFLTAPNLQQALEDADNNDATVVSDISSPPGGNGDRDASGSWKRKPSMAEIVIGVVLLAVMKIGMSTCPHHHWRSY